MIVPGARHLTPVAATQTMTLKDALHQTMTVMAQAAVVVALNQAAAGNRKR
jgi:hypothetical protein